MKFRLEDVGTSKRGGGGSVFGCSFGGLSEAFFLERKGKVDS